MDSSAGGFPKLTYVGKETTVQDLNDKIAKLTEALEAYQKFNRLHNDDEADLWEKGELALGRPLPYEMEEK